MKICCFSGGRGAQKLLDALSKTPNVHLTVVINGYDDGKSTGEIRRLIPEFLGPSDFRKVISSVLPVYSASQYHISQLMEIRLKFAKNIGKISIYDCVMADGELKPKFIQLDTQIQKFFKTYLNILTSYLQKNNKLKSLALKEMAFGNLIFAGAFIYYDFDFDKALEALVKIFSLDINIVSATHAGGDLTLVGLLEDGVFLNAEEKIVDSHFENNILEVFLVKSTNVRKIEKSINSESDIDIKLGLIKKYSTVPKINQNAEIAILNADIIIYPPGTLHSSLFPSYIICHEAVKNSKASKKIMFGNLDQDNDTKNLSLKQIVQSALYYLSDPLNTSTSITHFLYDESCFNYNGRIPKFSNLEFRHFDFRSKILPKSHSSVASLTAVMEVYFCKTNTPSITIIYGQNFGSDMRKDFELRANETMGSMFDIEFLPIKLDESLNQNFDFHNGVISGLNSWLEEGKTDFAAVIGYDGLYNLQDVYLLIESLKNNACSLVVGDRFWTKAQLTKARKIAYGQSATYNLFSVLGSNLIRYIIGFKYKIFMNDPLSDFVIISKSEVQRLNFRNVPAPSVLGLLLRIIDQGGKYISSPVRYLPLRGFRRKNKIYMGLKILRDLIM